jgi:hypothetical protein
VSPFRQDYVTSVIIVIDVTLTVKGKTCKDDRTPDVKACSAGWKRLKEGTVEIPTWDMEGG